MLKFDQNDQQINHKKKSSYFLSILLFIILTLIFYFSLRFLFVFDFGFGVLAELTLVRTEFLIRIVVVGCAPCELLLSCLRFCGDCGDGVGISGSWI